MKFFKYIGVCTIAIFSFYYTDKIANFVLEKNSLYQEINEVKDQYQVLSVAAEINGDYIIPGISGKKVNVKESYYNMKSLKTFNEYYLVYQSISPKVSLETNKNKIIVQGNGLKQSISFIIENDEQLINFFNQNNLKTDILVTLDDYKNKGSLELINNDIKNYDKLESILNNSNLNQNLCVINSQIESLCREKKKYLIKPLVIDNSNFLNRREELTSGNIYLLKKGLKIDNLKILLKDIQFKDLKIVYLSELIKEN